MTNQTQDLEQRAREVLNVIERQGVDWVRGSSTLTPHLQYGLEQGLYDQSVVDGVQKKYRASEAREVLNVIERQGVDWVQRSSTLNPHLQYGLEQGLYDQSAVDGAQKKYRASEAREVLNVIERQGIDWIHRSATLTLHLRYGLENGLYGRSEMDLAQERYEASRRK